MALYQISTIEKFSVTALYEVEADSKEEAVEKVKAGDVAYTEHEHTGYDDEFIVVTDVEVIG